MAIIQSKAINRNVPRPQTAGAVHFAKFTHTFDAAYTAAGNILEMGVLPPYSKIARYMLIPEGAYGGVTASMGVLSGELGAGGARAHNAELFSAATALTAAIEGVKPAAFDLERSATERGIGVTLSGDVAANAATKLHLLLFYYQ